MIKDKGLRTTYKTMPSYAPPKKNVHTMLGFIDSHFPGVEHYLDDLMTPILLSLVSYAININKERHREKEEIVAHLKYSHFIFRQLKALKEELEDLRHLDVIKLKPALSYFQRQQQEFYNTTHAALKLFEPIESLVGDQQQHLECDRKLDTLAQSLKAQSSQFPYNKVSLHLDIQPQPYQQSPADFSIYIKWLNTPYAPTP